MDKIVNRENVSKIFGIDLGIGTWATAKCPAHDDKSPSLGILCITDGDIVFKCHAGCEHKEIYSIVKTTIEGDKKMSKKDINNKNQNNSKEKKVYQTLEEAIRAALGHVKNRLKKGNSVKMYKYRNSNNEVIMLKLRIETEGTDDYGKSKKEFRAIHKHDKGYSIGDPEPKFCLYNLPNLGNSKMIFLTEGEKAADAINSMGLVATTWHGSSYPYKTDWSHLKGKRLVIFPDNDEQGKKYIQKILSCVKNVGVESIKIIEPENLPLKGDAVEFLEQFDSKLKAKSALRRLAHKTEPINLDEYIGGHIRLIPLSNIDSKEVNWLWPYRIAMGKLNLFAGDPGTGKSFLTLDIAARVSAGKKWPDGSEKAEVGKVIIISAEDDPADTIRPRLEAMGANLDNILILKSIVEYNENNNKKEERLFNLGKDIDKLKTELKQHPDCKLVIIDPISAYMSGKDTHRDSEVREVLSPLSEFASERGVAVLAVSHLNKNRFNSQKVGK